MTPSQLAASIPIVLTLVGCAPDPVSEVRAEDTRASSEATLAGQLELSSGDQQHMGIELAQARSMTLAEERATFGRVVHDPEHASTVRSPFAGTLLAGDVVPGLGSHVERDQALFRLAPRWTPQELADLGQRRAGARAERAALEADLPALRKALDRARSLNDQDKSLSDRDLEAAERDLALAEARRAGVDELLATLEAATEGAGAAPLALSSGAAGEITDLAAHVGESVEAGMALAVVEDFRSPLVALDVPLEGRSFDAIRARVSLGGPGDPYLLADRVGPAPGAGGFGPTRAVLFRVRADAPGADDLRPDLPLVARLIVAGPERAGLVVPRSAVVRLAGRAFVYVRREEEVFERRAIELTDPVEGGWFVDEAWGVGIDAPIVVRGAQVLLSFELLGRQGEEEE